MNILSGPIQFFAPDDDGGGGGGESSGVSTVLQDFESPAAPLRASEERVEGEKPPDFSKLGGTPPKKEPVEPSKEPESGKAPEKEKKPATEAPKAKEPPSKASTEAAKATPPDKKTPEKVEATKKEEPAKGAAKKIVTEEEVDAMQPPPGAKPDQVKHLSEMKRILKETIKDTRATIESKNQEVEAIQAQIKALEADKGKLPPEVERELTELRAQRATFLTESDPKFQQEFNDKLTKAETGVESWLKRHGAKDDLIKEIKDAGIDRYERWPELIDKIKDPIERQEIIDLLRGRKQTFADRDERIKELRANPERFSQAQQERDKQERSQWANTVASKSTELAAKEDWLNEKDLPPNATEEQKKAIEEHNAAVKERGKKWTEYVRDAYNRNPDVTAEISLRALKAEFLEEENARLVTDTERLRARVSELEDRISKTRGASKITHPEGESPAGETSTTTKTTEEEGKVGGDGQSAIRNFPWGKKR